MTGVTRVTNETNISVLLDAPVTAIDTTLPFLDHMLATLALYMDLRLEVRATGDLRHHLIEDVAITMGSALARRCGPDIARYGDRVVPMDDALVHAVVDLGGRAYYRGRLPSRMYEHFMRSFAFNANATLHVRVLRGHDRHHVVEAAFKALGLALRDALTKSRAPLSTKGIPR